MSLLIFKLPNLQINISAQYFRNPIDSPMYLSGNFCQIRDGHFHYGLDIPTNNSEGWPIRAVADGFVSRIFVASYGYGKALFITHPNGLTSVYAHLRNFNEKVDDYTLAQHYKRQSNSLDIFPQKNLLKVRKGDIVAYSGNSGGSTGPHLHFEIRNGKNELINPQGWYMDIPDTMKPSIGEVVCYTSEGMKELSESERKDTFVLKHYEEVRFAAEIYDRAIFSENKLAPKHYSLFLDGRKQFECYFGTFTFEQNKFTVKHIDYDYYWEQGIKLQKLYREPRNACNFYQGNGNISLQWGVNYDMDLQVEDAAGHNCSKRFYILVLDTNGHTGSLHKMPEAQTPKTILANADSSIILKGSLETMTPLGMVEGKESVEITAPSHEPFDKAPVLSMRANNQWARVPQSKLLICYIDGEKKEPLGGSVKKGYVTNPILIPGSYCIASDTNAPSIEIDSMVSDYLSFKVSDDFTGVGYYKATIDGKFALVSYDSKAGKIIFKKDRYTPIGKHEFKLVVGDKKQNYNSWKEIVIW